MSCHLEPALRKVNRPSARLALGSPGTAGPLEDFAGSVRQVIAMRLREGPPDMRVVAAAMGIGVRTLQRRLAGAGGGYARLPAEVRRDMAMRLLQDTRITCAAIGLALGYSDHAHFTRAFRQWTGTAPSEFREATLWASRPAVDTCRPASRGG